MAIAVISTIGHDRPGLVHDITTLAEQHQVNIEDSRMTVVGGEFAVLMSLTGALDQLRAFDQSMQALTGDEMAYVYRETDARQADAVTRPYQATITAIDHPGIVAAIAGFFSARKINLQDVDTETSRAPHTGTPIFTVHLTAWIPADLKVHELKEAFEEFCAEKDLDGELEPLR